MRRATVQRTGRPVVTLNELNFRKNVVTDILSLLDNFPWIPERKISLNRWKYRLERSWYGSCALIVLVGTSAVLFHLVMMKPMWFVCVVLIMSLYLLGCAGFDTEELAHVSGSSATEFDDEGEKNLAAIRALMSTERERASPASESNDKPKPKPDSSYWVPPDWLSSYFASRPSAGQESDLSSEYVRPSSSPRSPRRTAPGDVTAKIPWVPKPSSRGTEAEPWPHVPPYMVSPPGGSVYPGTIRCVPDSLGGQRCHAE